MVVVYCFELRCGVVWSGVVWCGAVRLVVAWRSEARRGAAWHGVLLPCVVMSCVGLGFVTWHWHVVLADCLFSVIELASRKVHLEIAKGMDWVASALKNGKEVICNLDQNPDVMCQIDRLTPCILASTSNMWGILKGRPMTPCELLTAQQIPVYERTSHWAGFPEIPLTGDGCSPASVRRMAGNSFNLSCSVGFVAYTMALMKPVGRDDSAKQPK